MSLYDKKNITTLIKAEAIRLGFSNCGISPAEELKSEKPYLEQWLQKGFHAEMHYMDNHFEKRLNPTLLVPRAKSVISVGLNYYPGDLKPKENHPKISKYALGRDYHKVMKKKLKQLYTYLQDLFPNVEGRYFVDSAPVLDKTWAEKSGLGWKGKHGLIINKEIGSFFFIGEIICNLELEPDTPIESYCGSCRLCIDACPTQAITEAYSVDANLCISYQTIENKRDIPNTIVPQLQDYIFGCDICQDVCPWNKKSVLSPIEELRNRTDLLALSYQDYENMTEDKFDTIFQGTPIKRAGFSKIKQTIKQIQKHRKNNSPI